MNDIGKNFIEILKNNFNSFNYKMFNILNDMIKFKTLNPVIQGIAC